MRIFPPASLVGAPGLTSLHAHGMPECIVLRNTLLSQSFFDFTVLGAAVRTERLDGVAEPVVAIGLKCGWVKAIEVRPPGEVVFVGTTSGRIWLRRNLPQEVWFLNSAPRALEACASAVGVFFEEVRELSAKRAALPGLIRHLLQQEEHMLEYFPRSYWCEYLESVVVDLGSNAHMPWREELK